MSSFEKRIKEISPSKGVFHQKYTYLSEEMLVCVRIEVFEKGMNERKSIGHRLAFGESSGCASSHLQVCF